MKSSIDIFPENREKTDYYLEFQNSIFKTRVVEAESQLTAENQKVNKVTCEMTRGQ